MTIKTADVLSCILGLAIFAAIITTHVLCVEYCLESWSGKEWGIGICCLIAMIPGTQASFLAAIITCCVI